MINSEIQLVNFLTVTACDGGPASLTKGPSIGVGFDKVSNKPPYKPDPSALGSLLVTNGYVTNNSPLKIPMVRSATGRTDMA